MPAHLTAEQRQLALRLKARARRYAWSGRGGLLAQLVRNLAEGGVNRPQRRINPWAPGGRLAASAAGWGEPRA